VGRRRLTAWAMAWPLLTIASMRCHTRVGSNLLRILEVWASIFGPKSGYYKIFRNFSYFVQERADILPQIRTCSQPSISTPMHYPLVFLSSYGIYIFSFLVAPAFGA
jgi:hypothetical protein